VALQFALLQFVPDPGKGEFVNVGALAGDEEAGEWGLRLVGSYRRAKALDEFDALPVALAAVTELEELIDGRAEELTGNDVRQLSSEMRNVLQLSDLRPIGADSVEAALEQIFRQAIVEPQRHALPYMRKSGAVKETRKAYRDHVIPGEAIAHKPRIQSGKFAEEFDFAVHNGRAVQLVQCWSFQLPKQEELAEQIKAWAWTAAHVKDGGGELYARGASSAVEIPRDIEVSCVYVKPREGELAPAFE